MPEQNNQHNNQQNEDALVEEIMQHLDGELKKEALRMSVIVDENAKQEKEYSSKCCNSYGRPSTETVGLLDMYTDLGSKEYDRE